MMFGSGDGWWFFMWMWMAAFWLLVLVCCGALLWSTQQPRGERLGTDDILKQRLARGEIDVDQYRALGAELGPGDIARGRRSGLSQILLVAFAVVAIVTLLTLPAIAAARGDWNWFDHMGRMMNRGGNTADSPLVDGGNAEAVTIDGFAFSPGNLRVPVGATVTWVNRDSVPHDAKSRDRSWETETLSGDEDDSVTFAEAGVYEYYCSIHPSMKACLSVE